MSEQRVLSSVVYGPSVRVRSEEWYAKSTYPPVGLGDRPPHSVVSFVKEIVVKREVVVTNDCLFDPCDMARSGRANIVPAARFGVDESDKCAKIISAERSVFELRVKREMFCVVVD